MANNYDDDDDIVTLMNADGEEVDFTEIAGINYKGNFYAILQPVELLEGMDDDEALVFRVKRGRDGSDNFEIETDDDIIDAVFREYNRLLDEQTGGGSGNSGRSSSRSSNSGSRNSGRSSGKSSGKQPSKVMISLPFILAAVLFVLAIVASSLNWTSAITTVAFLGALACVIWGIVSVVMYFIKKAKRK